MLSQNYTEDEINKFSDHAFEWWDPNGSFKTLHQINPLRLCFIKERCHLSGLNVLDIGCGGGLLAESLAKEGAIVTGIDLSTASINVAKLHQLESNLTINYKLSSVEDLRDSHAGYFDVITCLEMLEHVPNPQSVISAAAQLIKPGGHLFFSTLNRHPKAYLLAVIGAEYLLKWLPKNTHDYKKFIRPSELCQFLASASIKPKEFKGISYHLLKKEFYLSDDISVNYLLHTVKQ